MKIPSYVDKPLEHLATNYGDINKHTESLKQMFTGSGDSKREKRTVTKAKDKKKEVKAPSDEL